MSGSGRSTLLIAFDVGGTYVRAGLYDPGRHKLVDTTTIDTDRARSSSASAESRLSRLLRILDEAKQRLVGEACVAAVVAFPGPITADGMVRAAPTIWPGQPAHPFHLGAYLRRAWRGVEVTVLNDVTAAGLAYAAEGRRDFCIVTISSGVGHKVFRGGLPLVGATGRGGEIGHLVVDERPNAPICDCGGRGHLAATSSGRGTLRLAQRLALSEPVGFSRSRVAKLSGGAPETITSEMLAGSFRAGDDWTREVVLRAMRPLGRMLCTVDAVLGADDFVIVGGFADALGPEICTLLSSSAEEAGWQLEKDWQASVSSGHLGDEAGLLGAGLHGARTSIRPARNRASAP